jgi:D-serine deaminase-like pyridoxal phosphate-dependent protein
MESLKQWEYYIGKRIGDLPTPALVADRELIQANIMILSGFCNSNQCRLRPHFKSHKCVTLAQRQLADKKTIGITCAKVSEAEQLVEGGIKNILIANQIIGEDKVRRVARLNHHSKVWVTVDSREGIEQLNRAAQHERVKIGVLVEIDIGMNRGGVKPGKPAIQLAESVDRTSGLIFEGLQSYEGHIVTLADSEDRKKRVTEAMMPVLETRKALIKKGFSVMVSAGGTGTYDITGRLTGIDEIQCGSYVLMDTVYKKVRPEFHNARSILSTVISKRAHTITTDVGLKGMGIEYGIPEIIGHLQAKVLYVAEEHTVIENIDVPIGEKIQISPPHGCTTNNLYSKMWITCNDIVEEVWPIEGHGCLE